jgi:regulatory protein
MTISEKLQAAIEHYCKYQERCHNEVKQKLWELGSRGSETEELIAKLIESGLLNEERYARAIARGKFRMMNWGKNKIIQTLKQNKVSDYCIKKALTEIDEDDYEATMNRLLQKKYEELKTERSKLQKKAKLYRYLVQKGYETHLVSVAVNGLFTKE